MKQIIKATDTAISLAESVGAIQWQNGAPYTTETMANCFGFVLGEPMPKHRPKHIPPKIEQSISLSKANLLAVMDKLYKDSGVKPRSKKPLKIKYNEK